MRAQAQAESFIKNKQKTFDNNSSTVPVKYSAWYASHSVDFSPAFSLHDSQVVITAMLSNAWLLNEKRETTLLSVGPFLTLLNIVVKQG